LVVRRQAYCLCHMKFVFAACICSLKTAADTSCHVAQPALVVD